MKIDKVLMPIDFSPRSLAALERTIDLAREHHSEIVLVHIIDSLPNRVGLSDPTKLLEHKAEDGRNQLAAFTKRALSLYPKCTSELHFGMVDQVILELARKLNVDLIVVSARSQRGLLERILGSLVEKLVRQAPCPVLAVQVDGGSEKETHAALA